MPFYQKKGQVPEKRHIQFRNKNNDLYWEELISRGGFSSIYSNTYHKNPPTAIEKIGECSEINLSLRNKIHKPYHIRTANINDNGDAVFSRIPLFYNQDITVYKSNVTESMVNLYKNAYADELLFIQNGNGVLSSNFGSLNISKGDYVIIPRGVIWEIKIKTKMKILTIESGAPIETPAKYRNKFGQLLEHSPFSERDIKTPNFEKPIDKNSIKINVKYGSKIQSYFYQNHPFDLVGWDGYYFPWVFNINDFMPITGKIHQPPPVHQTFQSNGFVICSFVPRLFDYHEKSIPAPYAHSNVDSEELIFYVEGNFMSRKGIDSESITYHPMGLTHGPQPGKIEESLNAKETTELAVMIDTFKPLNMTNNTKEIEDKNYPYSWKS